MFKRFWFSDPDKGVAQYRFDEIKRSDRNSSICIDPKPEIINKLWLKNRQALNSASRLDPTFAQVPFPCAEW